MKDEVYKDTANRSKGSLSRAILYGNNNAIVGQNKGLRKAYRNAPKTISLGALGVALSSVPPGVSTLIGMVVDTALSKCKSLYSDSDLKSSYKKPMSFEESIRKSVKKDIKSKNDEIVRIDRNLVKMKEAVKKITPAVTALMNVAPKSSHHASGSLGVSVTKDKEKEVYDAYKSVAESEYYIIKLMGLLNATEEGLVKTRAQLDTLLTATKKTGNDINNYVEDLV